MLKNKQQFLGCIYVLIFSTVLVYVMPSCRKQAKEMEVDSEWINKDKHVYEYGICIDTLDVSSEIMKRGDSPASIFADLGFSPAFSDSISRASANVLDPKKLQAGMQYYAFTTQDSLSAVRYVVFAKSQTDFAVIDLTGDSVISRMYSKPLTIKQCFTEGTITSTLWSVIQEQGADPLLAIRLSDVFAWQIDFFDIKEGDSFRVLYDVSYTDDTTALNIVDIEGAQIIHDGELYTAIPFMQDSVREFFDANGRALRKAFLKAPLNFYRITSRFTNARFHPILKRYRPHHGVDYSAPRGTAVHSIGQGTIIFKGWMNGGGNSLRIRHNGSYETSYMHLSRFARGIHRGSHVEQGQIIGYVGSTGLATGPHLDFRVYKGGTAINPLRLQAPQSEPIRPQYRDSFNIVKKKVIATLNKLSSKSRLKK